MNCKGQFSIIAALLVAVVLVSTVIITYSVINTSPIQVQPQILTTIDETNFALKEILSFAVGYYGSVLQITGNSTYAKELAINYTHSGLENIARMHPELGASFNLSVVDLSAYWYSNNSWSKGRLAVNYSLAGLGLYGMTYETSCALTVQVKGTTPNNQTVLLITKDEGEPLLNLEKQNFKFYRYIYVNSTWVPINPTVEPEAYANGTYLVSIPPEIDPSSYIVQIEDQRGITVIAASFSRYICTLTWNTTISVIQDYVDNNISDVDSSGSKGTHGNFSAMQAGPDSIFDMLTEEESHINFTLLDDGFEAADWDVNWDNISHNWQRDNNPVHSGSASAWASDGHEGNFTCDNLNASDATTIYIEFWFRKDDTDAGDFMLYYYNGSNYNFIDDLTDNGGDDTWLRYSHKVTDSQYFKSNFRIKFYANLGSGENVWVDDVLIIKETRSNYRLDLEVQWTNAYYTAANEELCIYGGNMGSEDIRVDVWNGSAWTNLLADLSNGWNNISVSSYLNSPTFTIRFRDGDETSDAVQDSWNIDAVLLRVWPTENLYQSLRDATVVVEFLQNGTMRWLGQNLNLATQAKPIPPIPVKAIHVNQTINGVEQEVPFQIEDWASDYKIPLGLTNNASIFNNRHMIVFLVNPNVTKVTIWWNGSDIATQTPLAYVNKYFSYTFGDEYHPITINNTILKLAIDFSGSGNSFKAISTVGTCSATTELMRINQDTAHYGHSRPMYAVLNGTVRAVLHHEVEWPDGGVSNCSNVYSHIVLTLPANATYYTYQLRLMFVNSSQYRTIKDLCPIKLSFSSGQPQTENGMLGEIYPDVSNATGLFYNFSVSCWQHHWSQLVSGVKGAGIMFTDNANKMLYVFDAIAGNKTGAFKVSSGIIELCPVTNMSSVSFTHSLDVIWYGAVVTFDGTTPIYKSDYSGLWITVEYPPVITVTTEN